MVQFVSKEKVFCRRFCLLPPMPLPPPPPPSSLSSSSSSSLDFFFLLESRVYVHFLLQFPAYSHFYTNDGIIVLSPFIHLQHPASLLWDKMFPTKLFQVNVSESRQQQKRHKTSTQLFSRHFVFFSWYKFFLFFFAFCSV